MAPLLRRERYYDIIPANNTNTDATIRVNYFDGELNGIHEDSLGFFKSDNTIDWSELGFTSRDLVANFAEKAGIGSLSRLTLARLDNVLPVRFLSFNIRCDGNRMAITWKTAQEQNSSHFNIEKGTDGIHWMVTGVLPAAGNSANERNYRFTDNSAVQNAFYRIAEYDLDGRVQYTNALTSSCNIKDEFTLWPNPAREMVFINVTAGNESQAVIKVFDSRGALVKIQKETVLQGNNQLKVDIRSLANGAYSFYIDWNNGQIKKALQVIKR